MLYRPPGGEPGCHSVATATEFHANAADVHVALGSRRYVPPTAVVLLEDDRDLGVRGSADHIDHRLDLVISKAVRLPVGPAHRGPDQAAATCVPWLEHRTAERSGQDRKIAKRRPVPQLTCHRFGFDAGREKPGGKLMYGDGRRGVLEGT